jgi:uncharacterized phosphosugar-binding protein
VPDQHRKVLAALTARPRFVTAVTASQSHPRRVNSGHETLNDAELVEESQAVGGAPQWPHQRVLC